MKSKSKQGKIIRTGDEVMVISGNERGKTGKVLARKDNDRVIVQGINVRKKAMRQREGGQKGGFVDIECPIHVSKLCLCDTAGKAVKVKARINEQGEKELFYYDGTNEVLYRPIKKAK